MKQTGWRLGFKRAFDRGVAAAGLIASAPIQGAAALAILATMGRPVLFRQRRPGRDGEIFEVAKFRTMRHGTATDAARLTPLGRFLRASSIDELPQLWNVLRGELSLVGPRPLLESYLPLYSPEQMRRHEVLPGITGWAQVNGRNLLSWPEKFRMDVWYVDHWSIWLDLKILAQTVSTVVFRRGIAHADAVTMHAFSGER